MQLSKNIIVADLYSVATKLYNGKFGKKVTKTVKCLIDIGPTCITHLASVS